MGANILRAGHLTRPDGSEIDVPDPDAQRERFDRALAAPLNTERLRAVILQEVVG